MRILLFVLALLMPQAFPQGQLKKYDDLPALYQKAFQLSATHEKDKLELWLETRDGYFVYKDSFKVESENFDLQIKKTPPSFKGVDPVTKKLKEFFKDQNIFDYQSTLKTNAPSELKDLVVTLQACSKENCLLPVKVLVPIQVTPSMSANTNPSAPEVSTESGLAAKIKEIFSNSGGILSFKALLILLFAGLLTAISPCVLPLFPLTLGIFARWSHKNTERAFALVLSYSAGIILFFAVNGVISAATGGIFGALAQNPYYLLTLGILTLVAGLIFSGRIPFPFANSLLKLAGSPDTSDKPQSFAKLSAKSFAMGASLGLVASPCVGPVLLALLAWLSSELPRGDFQSYAAGFIALSVFGFGLALPFMILGHFYFRLHKRVSLGKYTVYAKYAGSIMLIGSSFFFIVPAYKILAKSKNVAEMKHDAYKWEEKPTGKWLVVDFRADWCAACIEIENEILMQKDVKSYMSSNNWALVQIDMTIPETHEKTAQEYGVISLPTVLFIDPQGNECQNLRLNEKESYQNFLKRLQSAEGSCR